MKALRDRIQRWICAADIARLESDIKDLRAALHLANLATMSVRQRLVAQTRRVRELEEWQTRFDRRRR